MGPIRALGPAALLTVKAEDVRQVNEQDLLEALRNVRPSVGQDKLGKYLTWSEQFGTTR